MLPYGRQTIEQDDIEAVAEALRSDFLTTGPRVQAFEKALAESVGAKEAVVVGNGTHALHLACLAAGLGPGDFAIVPSVTFLATANAVRYCGADVLFCDVDPQTGLIDMEHLKELLSIHTDKAIKAVLPVHLTGQLVDLEAIQALSKHYGFKVIADTCHALGSVAGEYQAGSGGYEDMSTFSFHPVKTIAMGEGGAITTNDKDLAGLMRRLRSHGMEAVPEKGLWFYEMKDIGYNYRATDLQCALGLSQLKKLDRFVEARSRLVALYDSLLESLDPIIKSPKKIEGQNPAWHLYALRIDFEAIGQSRDRCMHSLRDAGIGTQVHYIPIHTQPYYVDLYGEQSLPGAEAYYKSTLSIPLFPAMQDTDVHRVVKALGALCRE